MDLLAVPLERILHVYPCSSLFLDIKQSNCYFLALSMSTISLPFGTATRCSINVDLTLNFKLILKLKLKLVVFCATSETVCIFTALTA